MNIYEKLKLFVAQKGLIGTVWITKVKCLGFCNNIGTTLVIHQNTASILTVIKNHV